MKFLFYSHDGMGLGHTRRHLAIAAALTELAPAASVMLATGADEVNRLGLPPHVEILKLPALRKLANEQYGSRRLRIPAAEIRALRAALLTATVKAFRPQAVLVDKHPFGAGGEFREALEIQREHGVAVLGLRDILDAPATVLAEWNPHHIQQNIAAYYDEVLVYGQRAVFDPIREYGMSEEVAARTRFCGYIVNRPDNDGSNDLFWRALVDEAGERPIVVASAGGGEDGYRLLETFMRASVRSPWRAVAIAGPMTPEPEFKVLQRLAVEAGVVFQQFVPNLSTWFWSANALVCMGGYNTLTEALCTGIPTVCVPRVLPRTEQLIRAQAFEKLGLLRNLNPDSLSVESMRAAISASLNESRQELIARANQALNFDGAHQAASHLLAVANEKRERRVAKQSLAS